MLVRIRLMCTGRKRINSFRIVIIDSRMKRSSLRSLCDIGYYLPQRKDIYLKMNVATYDLWIKNGAQPTKRVLKLYAIASANAKYNA